MPAGRSSAHPAPRFRFSSPPVVDALVARDADVFRLNTAWFPTELRVVAELDDDRWRGALHTPHGRLDLDSVHAVWYRSPEAYRMPSQLSPAEAQHARVEAKYGLGGVLASLPVLWCNHPGRVADAAYKPLQLVRAVRCGLTVPKTLITSDAAAAPGLCLRRSDRDEVGWRHGDRRGRWA